MGKHDKKRDVQFYEEASDDDDIEEPMPPKRKPRPPKDLRDPEDPPPKSEPPPSAATPPKKRKLTKLEREEIVRRFNEEGVEDPEYRVIKLANGGYRCLARKAYTSPTAKVEKKVGANKELNMKWMNMQTAVNEELVGEIRKLRKKYDKLSGKYQKKKEEPPADLMPEPQAPTEEEIDYIKQWEEELRRQAEARTPARCITSYTRGKPFNIHDI
jgi:hypothetical protein